MIIGISFWIDYFTKTNKYSTRNAAKKSYVMLISQFCSKYDVISQKCHKYGRLPNYSNYAGVNISINSAKYALQSSCLNHKESDAEEYECNEISPVHFAFDNNVLR